MKRIRYPPKKTKLRNKKAIFPLTEIFPSKFLLVSITILHDVFGSTLALSMLLVF